MGGDCRTGAGCFADGLCFFFSIFFFFPFFSPSLFFKAIKALSAALRPPIPERTTATALLGCAGGQTEGYPPLCAAHLQREQGFSICIFFRMKKRVVVSYRAQKRRRRSAAKDIRGCGAAAAARPFGNKALDRRSECCIFYSHEIKHIIFHVG